MPPLPSQASKKATAAPKVAKPMAVKIPKVSKRMANPKMGIMPMASQPRANRMASPKANQIFIKGGNKIA